MKKLYITGFLLVINLFVHQLYSQELSQAERERLTPIYSQAIDSIIIEPYYIADAHDATDEDGVGLVEGAVTWRVFVDMKPGYVLRGIWATPGESMPHSLLIETTTEFFNNDDRGTKLGYDIPSKSLQDNTVSLDSWVTVGAVSDIYQGVLKSEDTDGALENNDGFLQNDHSAMGIPLTQADGLISGSPQTVSNIGLDLNMFGADNDGPAWTADDGMWLVADGVQGPTETNRVLIGQFTTDGNLSCKFNIQIGIANDDSVRCALCGFPPGCSTEEICGNDNILFVHQLFQNENPPSDGFMFELAGLNIYKTPPEITENRKLFADVLCTLYPNPTGDYILLSLKLTEIPEYISKKCKYSILDISGRSLYENETLLSSALHEETINLESYAKGLYFLRISIGKEIQYHQIIKQ